MLEELNKLIIFINKEYNIINNEWQQNNLYIHINKKKKLVKDVNQDNEILNVILKYRLFLNEKHLDLKLSLKI